MAGTAAEREPIAGVYVLHFSEAVHHAKHYVGASEDIVKRCIEHRDGNASKLTTEVKNRGGKLTLGRAFRCQDPYALERWIKSQKQTPSYCLTCQMKWRPDQIVWSGQGLLAPPSPHEDVTYTVLFQLKAMKACRKRR